MPFCNNFQEDSASRDIFILEILHSDIRCALSSVLLLSEYRDYTKHLVTILEGKDPFVQFYNHNENMLSRDKMQFWEKCSNFLQFVLDLYLKSTNRDNHERTPVQLDFIKFM